MLPVWFNLWARFWHDLAATLEAEDRPVRWVIEFGAIKKELAEVHPQTGLPKLIAPTKERIEKQLLNAGCAGLTIVLRIEPSRGLTYALQGPRRTVERARKRLEAAHVSASPADPDAS